MDASEQEVRNLWAGRRGCAKVIVAALLAILCGGMAGIAAADEAYPNKPVRLISPLPAGAAPDVATRAWMQCVSGPQNASQAFVLDNKPGANGVVAAQLMRTAPADGYTIMVAGMSQTTITPFIFKKKPYDPQKEFEGAAIYGWSPFVLVANAQSGIKSIDDLKKAAGAAASGLDIGIPAVGSPAHVLSAAVSDRLGLKATLVPVAGEPGGVTSLLANQMSVFVFLVGSARQYIEKGQMVPLLAFTPARLPELPQVPTVVEVFGDAQLAREGWIGVTTKAGSPPHVARSLELWTKRCLDTPEFQQAVRRSFFHPRFAGRDEFNKVVNEDIAFWSHWIRELRITND